jgi:hypothetical protein
MHFVIYELTVEANLRLLLAKISYYNFFQYRKIEKLDKSVL